MPDRPEVTRIPVKATSSRSNATIAERAQLRDMVHEDVMKMCEQRRAALWAKYTAEHPEWSQGQVEAQVDYEQPLFVDYDPVVMMAVMSANYEYPPEVRLRAAAESAQFMRPKLKSIEMTVDPMSAEQRARRDELAARLVGLLDVAAEAKRGTVVEGTARSGSSASAEQTAPNPPAPSGPIGDEDARPEQPAAEDPTSGAGRVEDR